MNNNEMINIFNINGCKKYGVQREFFKVKYDNQMFFDKQGSHRLILFEKKKLKFETWEKIPKREKISYNSCHLIMISLSYHVIFKTSR